MEIKAQLAARTRQHRQAKGWSQEQLADEAGLHRTFISQIEREKKNTTIAAVEKVANALGVTIGELLD